MVVDEAPDKAGFANGLISNQDHLKDGLLALHDNILIIKRKMKANGHKDKLDTHFEVLLR